MATIIRPFTSDDYSKVLDFYRGVDKDYLPRLSDRDGGLEGHISQIINNNGSFILYNVNGAIQGVAGWFPLDREKQVIKFSFFAFEESLRGTLAPYRLLKWVAERRKEFDLDKAQIAVARTFSKESSRRLSGLGMEQEKVVVGDIVPERTSYYFRGDLNLIVANILKKAS